MDESSEGKSYNDNNLQGESKEQPKEKQATDPHKIRPKEFVEVHEA